MRNVLQGPGASTVHSSVPARMGPGATIILAIVIVHLATTVNITLFFYF